jgi:hypothetical protein
LESDYAPARADGDRRRLAEQIPGRVDRLEVGIRVEHRLCDVVTRRHGGKRFDRKRHGGAIDDGWLPSIESRHVDRRHGIGVDTGIADRIHRLGIRLLREHDEEAAVRRRRNQPRRCGHLEPRVATARAALLRTH